MVKIYLFLTFITISSFSFGQEKKHPIEYQVIYKYMYQTDSLKKDSKKEELMELLTTQYGETFYQSFNKGLRDSIILADKIDRNRGINQKIQLQTQYNINSTIFQLNNNLITRDSYINSLGKEQDYFYYQENIDLDWELHDNIDSIQGIPVQMATCKLKNHTWTAWFATEINLPYGPYKFFGLPGLILKIEDDKGYFSFEMVSIQKKNSLVISFPNEEYIEKKLITKDQYLKDKYYYLENRTIIDIQNKEIFFGKQDSKVQAIAKDKERLKKYNIWIERFL